jgi:hypothetical protein
LAHKGTKNARNRHFFKKKVRYRNNGLKCLQEFLFAIAFFDYFTESAAVVSTATVSTATTVESVAGAVSAALGAQDAKAIATTKNKITFFISFKILKFNMFVFAIQNRCKVTSFFYSALINIVFFFNIFCFGSFL